MQKICKDDKQYLVVRISDYFEMSHDDIARDIGIAPYQLEVHYDGLKIETYPNLWIFAKFREGLLWDGPPSEEFLFYHQGVARYSYRNLRPCTDRELFILKATYLRKVSW